MRVLIVACLLFSCAENHNHLKYIQDISLRTVFAHVHLAELEVYSHGLGPEDACLWYQHETFFTFQCVNETLKIFRVLYFQATLGQFQIQYMPASVEEMQISSCMQRIELHTRFFPRMARKITLDDNAFFGCPDLRALPEHLKFLHLQRNVLSGPIVVCNLPPNVQEIDLSGNRIKQTMLLYGDLPNSLISFNLFGNNIRGVRCVSGNEKEVFTGIRQKSWRTG